MGKAKFSLTALLLLGLMSVPALAQEPQPTDKKPAPVSWNEDKEPKNEVELMLAAALKRGEIVLGSCIDNCPENPDYEVPEGYEPGRAIELPKPAYSTLARRARVSGTVVIQVLIDVDGKVVAAAAVSGHPLLYSACLQAARESTFTPTKWEGQPVKVTGVLQYNFIAM